MKSVLILMIGGCLLVACNNPPKRKNQINKIEIATSGCLRGCPAIGISVDSSLTYIYYGGWKAKLQGYYAGKVTQSFWDTLNMKLEYINFKRLDTSKYLPIDGEPAEAIFYWNKQKRHIFKSIDDDPDSVSHALIWIANSYKRVKLHKLQDSVSFESSYHFLRPPDPPKPKKDQVKFPPPIKDHGKKSVQ